MLAFPTAQGYGAETIGGRGGRVVFIDNTNDDGPGSYRAALQTNGPRYVIPRASGTCTLKSIVYGIPPFISIHMQASPNGFQLKGSQNPLISDGTIFSMENIIVRCAKVRQGGPGVRDMGAAMMLYSTDSATRLHHAIFDKVSFTWGLDAPMSAYGYGDAITFQNCIIGNGCDNGNTFASGQSTGNKGDLHNITGNISILRNLYANNASRNPYIQQAALFDFRMNVIYNWSVNNGGHFGETQTSSPQRAIGNIVNNIYIPGPNSGKPAMVLANGPIFGGATKVFAQGNLGPNRPQNVGDEFLDIYEIDSYYKTGGPYGAPVTAGYRASSPYPSPNTLTIPTAQVLDWVLRNAGARYPSLDSADQSVIESVIHNTGNIASIGYGGPWPIFVNEEPPPDDNHDGVPNLWANLMGFGPMEMIANRIDPGNGYPHIENYLNWLAGDFPDIDLEPDPIVVQPPVEVIEDPIPVIDPVPEPPVIQTAGVGDSAGFLMLGLAALLWVLWTTSRGNA